MIFIPPSDDIKVFNMKTFRDPLSNVIEINPKSQNDLKKNTRKKETVVLKSALVDELDAIKIWNPRSNHK